MEAAFFDLDKTVIAKPSLVAFGRPLYDAGMISRAVILRALWSNFLFHRLGAGESRMRRFRRSALRVTRGWDQTLVSALVRDTLVDVIEPIVYAEALDLIQQHRETGRRVFLVSASPEEIVAPLAQFVGVDEAIASRAELDEEGRYTGNVEFWSYGPYKAEAIEAAAARYGIDLDRSYAYSDSVTDLPMLEAVGHPVAVNPDRDLARVARDRQWEIRWFAHGVPLRERVPMPPPGRTLTVLALAALAAGGAVVVAWWWEELRGAGTRSVARRSGRRSSAPLNPSPGRARTRPGAGPGPATLAGIAAALAGAGSRLWPAAGGRLLPAGGGRRWPAAGSGRRGRPVPPVPRSGRRGSPGARRGGPGRGGRGRRSPGAGRRGVSWPAPSPPARGAKGARERTVRWVTRPAASSPRRRRGRAVRRSR